MPTRTRNSKAIFNEEQKFVFNYLRRGYTCACVGEKMKCSSDKISRIKKEVLHILGLPSEQAAKRKYNAGDYDGAYKNCYQRIYVAQKNMSKKGEKAVMLFNKLLAQGAKKEDVIAFGKAINSKFAISI